MAISNTALYNALTTLNNQVRHLRQQVCCSIGGSGLTQVYYDNSGTVQFSGSGTEDDPLTADAGSTSVDTIYTADGTITSDRTLSLNAGTSILFNATPAGSTDLQRIGINQETGTSFSYLGTRTSSTKYSEIQSYSGSLITQIEATNNQPLGVHRFQIDPTQITLIATNNTNSGFRSTHTTTGASWFANDGAVMVNFVASSKAVTFSGIPSAPTAANGTNTTQLATTAFVNNTIGAAGIATFNTVQKVSSVTTNDVPTTIMTIPTASNVTYSFEVRTVIRSSNNIEGGLITAAGLIINTAGTPTVAAEANVVSITTGGLNVTGITYTISGTNVLVQLVGAPATTINWNSILTVLQV